MRNMHDKEFENVLALPLQERYSYFVRQVADAEELWGLRSQAEWALAGVEGVDLVAVWSHPRFARACAIGEWHDTEPSPISLQDWLEKWVPGMKADGRRVAVFPDRGQEFADVDPEQLAEDIRQERSAFVDL